jgi:hypothetical protein
VTRSWLGDATADGLGGCLDAVLEVEFGEDAGDMVGDGVGADGQVVRDLVVAVAAGELGEDLEFSRGEGGADRGRGATARFDGEV